MRRTVPPSAEIQAEIDKLLSKGLVDDPQKMLSELARLGARLIIQRAVEEEFDTWLGRARYERRPERQLGLATTTRGSATGSGPGMCRTAEGELRIEIPQAREAAMPFVSKLFPKWHCKRLLRTDPLKALVIGGFVHGLSMRDVESLCEEAGLGKTSKSTVATICAELHERFEAFCRRYSTTSSWSCCSSTRSTCRFARAARRRVICAWGIDENGHRELVSVRLGAREAKEDWLELGRDLMSRGLAAPRWSWPTAPRAAHRGRGDLATGRSAALRRSSPTEPASEAPEVRARPDPLQLLVSANRRNQCQGRQAPPEGPHLRARAPRLRVGRPLPQ